MAGYAEFDFRARRGAAENTEMRADFFRPFPHPGEPPTWSRVDGIRIDSAAIIASSAFPMAYELVEISGGWWTDGGIVAKQPIHPAIRLGGLTGQARDGAWLAQAIGAPDVGVLSRAAAARQAADLGRVPPADPPNGARPASYIEQSP